MFRKFIRNSIEIVSEKVGNILEMFLKSLLLEAYKKVNFHFIFDIIFNCKGLYLSRINCVKTNKKSFQLLTTRPSYGTSSISKIQHFSND